MQYRCAVIYGPPSIIYLWFKVSVCVGWSLGQAGGGAVSIHSMKSKSTSFKKKKKTLNGPSHLVSKKPCVCISSVFTGHNWQGFLGMLYLAGNFLTIVIWYVQDFSFFMIFKIFFGQCLYLDSEFLPHFLCDLPPFFFSR